jgi:hypothetical protein
MGTKRVLNSSVRRSSGSTTELKLTNEPPSTPDKVDEHPGTSSVLVVTIHSISNEHSSNNLVPKRRNRDPNNRRHIISDQLINLHTENNQPNNYRRKSRIRDPDPVLRGNVMISA